MTATEFCCKIVQIYIAHSTFNMFKLEFERAFVVPKLLYRERVVWDRGAVLRNRLYMHAKIFYFIYLFIYSESEIFSIFYLVRYEYQVMNI